MIGRFLELSLQADDILASVEFYERLGFRQLQVGETWSHPYAVLSDGRIHIGLHRYEFESPALTFVLADLAAKLPHIERNGVTFKFRKLGADEFNEAGLVAPASQMIALLEARTYSPPSFDDVDFSRARCRCGRAWASGSRACTMSRIRARCCPARISPSDCTSGPRSSVPRCASHARSWTGR
jgi:hypothetical protein